MNKELAVSSYEHKRMLDSELEEIAAEVRDLREFNEWVIGNITFSDEDKPFPKFVYVKLTYWHCSSCGEQEEFIKFPFSYLWTPNYKDLEKKTIAKEKRLQRENELKEAALAEAERLRKKEADDLRDYLRLKKKFETTTKDEVRQNEN